MPPELRYRTSFTAAVARVLAGCALWLAVGLAVGCRPHRPQVNEKPAPVGWEKPPRP